MRISKIHTINQPKYYNINKNLSLPIASNPVAGTFASYSAENVKANFLPGFNGYRKVGTATIINRDTLMPVQADIRKQAIGDYSMFTLVADKKDAGFMVMKLDSVYPIAEHVMKYPNDNIPQISNLRTIAGDKYSGIGTALIKTAIQESYNYGASGNLWLQAQRGYEKNLCSYRSNENPIPFYYKVGFVSPDKEQSKLIKECIAKNELDDLPNEATLLLTQKARNKWLKELVENPIIKFKKIPIAS